MYWLYILFLYPFLILIAPNWDYQDRLMSNSTFGKPMLNSINPNNIQSSILSFFNISDILDFFFKFFEEAQKLVKIPNTKIFILTSIFLSLILK